MIRTACPSFASRGIIVCVSPEFLSPRGTNLDRSTVVFSATLLTSFRFAAKAIVLTPGRQYTNLKGEILTSRRPEYVVGKRFHRIKISISPAVPHHANVTIIFPGIPGTRGDTGWVD